VTEGDRQVRAIVLDYDGTDMTLACLNRLISAGCDNASLRIVLVDNFSRAPITDRAMTSWPDLEVRRSDRNRGFAGGVNLGLNDLDGIDFVALVNNDVEVDAGWLEPLVDLLAADPAIGAACPKMLLAGQFRELVLRVGERVRVYELDAGAGSGSAVQFVRGFHGPQRDADREWFEWAGPEAVLYAPAGSGTGDDRVRLRLGAEHPTTVTVVSGDQRTELEVRPGTDWYDVAVGGEPFDVINNVGNIVVEGGYGADRGFLERDEGQYAAEELVPAWCGGAVLLRVDYLRDVGLFDERLFLYYEDLDLSLRGAARGWRYRYEPRSTVRHRHGATAGHGSDFAERFKERNRLLVVLRHSGLRAAAVASIRFLLSTASYARRDAFQPLVHAHRPNGTIVARRLRSFFGFVRLAPSVYASRRRDLRRPER
jgi:GT2 family glycosyltransferase